MSYRRDPVLLELVDFPEHGVYALIKGILIQPAALLLHYFSHISTGPREASPLLDLLLYCH